MNKNNFLRIMLLFVLILIIAMPVQAQYREAKLIAITTWDAGCPDGNRPLWDDMGLAWYNEITSVGFHFGSWFGGDWWWFGHGPDAYTRDGTYINGNIADSWFTDSDIVWWGNDHNYVDEADACMVCLHGNDPSGRWEGSVRVNEAGPGNCRTWQGDMAFGDLDLEFLHLSSCHSLDDNQWFFEWLSSFDGLHQVDGFHGEMWIGTSLINDYEDFANDAFDIDIASAWLDNMYHANISGSCDQCPVAYAVGNNCSNMWNRIGNERYNYVYSDPTTIGYVGCIYISNCDPCGEDVCGDDAWSGGQEPKQALSSDYRDLVEKTLPMWDKQVLDVPIREIDWVDQISIENIANAVKDTIPYEQKEKEMYEEARDQDQKRIIKLDRSRGYVRYVNQDKQFRYETSSKKPIDTIKAKEIAKETIGNLGIPTDEFNSIKVDTVMGTGATPEAKEPSEGFARELLITMQRGLNNIPVFDSMARLAISNEGEVARLLVLWPHFNLAEDLELKDHKHIIEEITAQIEKLEEGRPIALTMQLAYISTEDDEQTRYVPGIVVTVRDEESGVIFTINIAE